MFAGADRKAPPSTRSVGAAWRSLFLFFVSSNTNPKVTIDARSDLEVADGRGGREAASTVSASRVLFSTSIRVAERGARWVDNAWRQLEVLSWQEYPPKP